MSTTGTTPHPGPGPSVDVPRSEEARNTVGWLDIHDESGGLNISQVEAFAHHVLIRIETAPPDVHGSGRPEVPARHDRRPMRRLQRGCYRSRSAQRREPRDESPGANRL